MPRRIALALAGTLLLAVGAARAQERPSEEELFGAPEGGAPPAAAPAPAPAGEGRAEPGRAAPGTPARPEEAQLFGAPPAAQAAPPPPSAGITSRLRDETFQVGGQLYLRAATAALEGQDAGDWVLSSPNLLDVYADARPNDRVRGFALGRLSYDPTAQATLADLIGIPTNPRAALDQLWINFDLRRTVFVTAGKQHVKWGVGRFWNPTDYLHPVRRDPLAVFDVRTGTAMVKLHAPWEARGWNLYGVTVLEDVAGRSPLRADGTRDGVTRLGRVGAGARAEVVLGTVEVGADMLAQQRHRPRFGVDVSAGVWDVDVYAEGALRTSVDTPRWRPEPGAGSPGSPCAGFARRDPLGFTPQITVGGTWSKKYSDEDAITLGGEYFYDDSGYASPAVYPCLLSVATLSPFPVVGTGGPIPELNPLFGEPNPFTPFYLGRHYAGAFVSLPRPGRWNDTTFTLSVIGNLSDRSFVARLDHSVLALTYLRVETYVAGRFGAREGEFRLGFEVPPQVLIPSQTTTPLSSHPTLFEAGVALRVSL